MENIDLVIIGGGAAGMFCAVNAARMNPDLKVVLLEKSPRLLAKVKVSGGGRCNVTHSCFSITEMVKRYPRGGNFLKKAFHQFFTTDTIEWFLQRGVQLKTEADGRMFPVTDNSQTIIDCLLDEAAKYNVDVRLNTAVRSLRKENELWRLSLPGEREISATIVCLATGGISKAALKDWQGLKAHSIVDPVPSLFTFNMPGNSITKLMGITVQDVGVKIMGSKIEERGPLLITHWGMSGPAILKTSAWGARYLAEVNYHFTVIINWLPGFNETTLRERLTEIRFKQASQKIYNRNPFSLPSRLWEYLLDQCGIKEETRWADLPAKEQNKLIKMLCAQEHHVKGKTTFKEEFVTAGGISLEQIDPGTMQSRVTTGLYFAGEIIDVDGITGGYNFQNAWTTGWIAAKSIAGRHIQNP